MLLSRRRFIQTNFCAVLAAAVRADEPPTPAVPLAFSLYGMRTLSLDDALTTCARIGYDAVELALMPGYHAEPSRLTRDERRRLRERLGELRLGLPSLMDNLPFHGPEADQRRHLDRLQAACELGRDLSPDRPPVVETILGGAVDQWDMLRRQFADRLGEWAQV